MKQFSIVRKRYVIIRDDTEILCGMMRNYKFRPIDKVKNAQLKTYDSEKRAWSAFNKYFGCSDEELHRYKVVAVAESIMQLREE